MIARIDPRTHHRIARAVDLTMTLLGIVFVGILVVQYTVDTPAWVSRKLSLASIVIWAIFAIDFFIRLAFAPSKVQFLRHNWIAALALTLPAFRVLRIVQIFRAAPSLQVAGVVSGGKRTSDLLHRSLQTHPLIYMTVLTLFIGALSTAGLFTLERTDPSANIQNPGDALWWTTATLTTIGCELYPVTTEGRALAIGIMVYSLGFAGYITAALAALILGNQQSSASAPAPPPASPDLAAVLAEIESLRRQLQAGADAAPSPTLAPPTNGPPDPAQPAVRDAHPS